MSMQSQIRTVRSALVPLVAAAALCLGSAAARANLVTNGSFENPSTSYYQLYTSSSASQAPIPGWTSNNSEIEVDTAGAIGLSAAADGSQSVELNGTKFDTISQTITGLTAGQKYLLTWAYAGRSGSGNQEMDVTFGSKLAGKDTSTGTGTMSWAYNSAIVTATGSSVTLSFAAINVGGQASVGNELDAVSLTRYVPEPASIAVLLSAIVGLVVVRRRRPTA